MRKLDRAAIAEPPCLARYQHGRDNWNNVAPVDKEQIRGRLEQMQGRRCAYCEGPLDALGQHIEHFRRKSRFPEHTFAWTNLYLSCNQRESCGHYKDSGAGAYEVKDLIEPCIDDPDRFFRFRHDGTIHVRPGLSPREQHRARETLRVLNLQPDVGPLRSMRQRAAKVYQAVEPGILDALIELSEAERRAFIEEEIHRTAGEPFSTVIHHLFEDVL